MRCAKPVFEATFTEIPHHRMLVNKYIKMIRKVGVEPLSANSGNITAMLSALSLNISMTVVNQTRDAPLLVFIATSDLFPAAVSYR